MPESIGNIALKVNPFTFTAIIPSTIIIAGKIKVALKDFLRPESDMYLSVSRYIRSRAFSFIYFLL